MLRSILLVLTSVIFYLHAEATHPHHHKYMPQPSGFGYHIDDYYGNTQQRQESRNPHDGSVKGSYGYANADGVYRTVYYVADAGGFRANVKTNEPGTDAQEPAHVHLLALQAPPMYARPHKYATLHAHRPMVMMMNGPERE